MKANRESDRIEFITEKMSDENGKMFIRIEIPVKQKEFQNNFFVHYRKKDTIKWQSSPLIRNSNFIDMHGLESNCVYEIRVAVLSPVKNVSTGKTSVDSVIDKINTSNKEKYFLRFSENINSINKFAADLVDKVIKDALDILEKTRDYETTTDL